MPNLGPSCSRSSGLVHFAGGRTRPNPSNLRCASLLSSHPLFPPIMALSDPRCSGKSHLTAGQACTDPSLEQHSNSRDICREAQFRDPNFYPNSIYTFSENNRIIVVSPPRKALAAAQLTGPLTAVTDGLRADQAAPYASTFESSFNLIMIDPAGPFEGLIGKSRDDIKEAWAG